MLFRSPVKVTEAKPAKVTEAKPAKATEAKQPIDDDVDLTEWFRTAEDQPEEEEPDILDELDNPPAAQEPEEQAETEPKKAFARDKSEAEKQRIRAEGKIVGVSEASQARRTAATSQEGAAEALRKLLSGGTPPQRR